MHDAAGWLLNEPSARTFLLMWFAGVLTFGLLRSRGDAPLDPVRESGPGA